MNNIDLKRGDVITIDWPGTALVLKCVVFTIGYILMDIYGRNYLNWKDNE